MQDGTEGWQLKYIEYSNRSEGKVDAGLRREKSDQTKHFS